ncbi:hypothetical protein [Candidatus Poriferisodalis sp.]|uniref:hypothetical protein n=1 Tax=Candidatus Poriferisodalis sp. TaxID=3101277 RepID=UPI003B520E28
MPTPVDTTAAMNDPAEHEAAAAAPAPPDTGHTPSADARTRSALGDMKPAGAGSAVSRSAIVNVVAAALVTAMFSMLMWQISSLGDRIDANGARIDASATELRAEIGALRTDMQTEIGALRTDMQTEIGSLRAEIGGLRAEMQAGFREINATLLDHTDRLARLETAAGLPRIVVTPESPDGEPQ